MVAPVDADLAGKEALEGEDGEEHLRPIGPAVDQVPVEEVLALLKKEVSGGVGLDFLV